MIPAVMPGLREMATKGADIRIDTELGLFYLLFFMVKESINTTIPLRKLY